MSERSQVWLDGEWVDAEQYLKAAEMCGAKTIGEAYGISHPSGKYLIDPTSTTPTMYFKIIRRNWFQRLWHRFYLWRNRKRIVTVIFAPGDYAYFESQGFIRKAEK